MTSHRNLLDGELHFPKEVCTLQFFCLCLGLNVIICPSSNLLMFIYTACPNGAAIELDDLVIGYIPVSNAVY